MGLCGLLVDRLSAYKPGLRWLNPGVIWKKNDPHEKFDKYLKKNNNSGTYTIAAVTYCGLVHRLSAYNPDGLRWFSNPGFIEKKMILVKNRYLFVKKKKMVAMGLCGLVDCPLIRLVFVGWIQASSGNKNDPPKTIDTCIYFILRIKIEKRQLWVRPIKWLKLNFASSVVRLCFAIIILAFAGSNLGVIEK